MSTRKMIKGVILLVKYGGLGIFIMIYLFASKTWLEFKEPVSVTSAWQLTEGEIVTFDTPLIDTGKVSRYTDGTENMHFYEGTLGGETVTLGIHHNFVQQIEKITSSHEPVIGKVRKMDGESDSLYVEILREDYKSSAIGLFGMGIFFLASGALIMVYTYKRKRHK